MNLVYIASPYRGDVENNVKMAKEYCAYAVRCGFIPICPHIYFTEFLSDVNETERQRGINMGLQLLGLCVEMWVFGKVTEGMQQEIDEAKRIGIPFTHRERSDEQCISTLKI